jgi:hypothetical protein
LPLQAADAPIGHERHALHGTLERSLRHSWTIHCDHCAHPPLCPLARKKRFCHGQGNRTVLLSQFPTARYVVITGNVCDMLVELRLSATTNTARKRADRKAGGAAGRTRH